MVELTDILSLLGLGNSRSNNIYNNPGNIQAGQRYAGETGKRYGNNRFSVYDSKEMGLRALAKDLKTKIKRHRGSIANIFAEYAPSNENDTVSYVDFIKSEVGKSKVSVSDLKPLMKAVIKQENSQPARDYYFEGHAIDEGIRLSELDLPSTASLNDARGELYRTDIVSLS